MTRLAGAAACLLLALPAAARDDLLYKASQADNEGQYLRAAELAIGVARDRAVTPNLGRHRWRFVTRVRSAPVISLPDTSFDEDHGLALNLHNYLHDPDNSLYELEITAGLLSGAPRDEDP